MLSSLSCESSDPTSVGASRALGRQSRRREDHHRERDPQREMSMRPTRRAAALLVLLALPAWGDVRQHDRFETINAEELAHLTPENARAERSGRVVFVPDSLTDDVGGCVLV